MNLVATHHLLLLRQLPHQLGHVLQRHVRRVSLARVDDALDLAVNVIESLQEVHVSQLDPELVLVVQVDWLVIDFDEAVSRNTVFNINDVRLVEEVVHNR